MVEWPILKVQFLHKCLCLLMHVHMLFVFFVSLWLQFALSLQNALHKTYSHDPKLHNLKQVGARWWQNNFMHHLKNSKCKRRLAQNLYMNSKGSQIQLWSHCVRCKNEKTKRRKKHSSITAGMVKTRYPHTQQCKIFLLTKSCQKANCKFQKSSDFEVYGLGLCNNGIYIHI